MKKLTLFIGAIAIVFATQAKEYAISTPNTTIIISASEGKAPHLLYYGSRAEIDDVKSAGRALKDQEAYPAYGTHCDRPFASLVKQHDGDNAVKLVVESVSEQKGDNTTTLSLLLRDVAHPTLAVKLNYSAYSDCDIIKMNTEYINEGKKLFALVDIFGVHLYDVAIGVCRIVQFYGKCRVRHISQQEREGGGVVALLLGDALNDKFYGVVAIVLLDERSERTVAVCTVCRICLLIL